MEFVSAVGYCLPTATHRKCDVMHCSSWSGKKWKIKLKKKALTCVGLEKWRCLLQCPRRRPHRGPRRRRPQGLERRASLTLRRRSVCVLVLMEGSVRAAVRTCLTDTTPSALVTFTTHACTSNRYAEPLPVTHIFTHISEVEYRNTDESFLHLAVQSVTWLNQTMTIWMFFVGFILFPCSRWILTQCVSVWLAVRTCVWTADGLHICSKSMTQSNWSLYES